MLCVACCAELAADPPGQPLEPPRTFAEAKLRMARDVSRQLREAPTQSHPTASQSQTLNTPPAQATRLPKLVTRPVAPTAPRKTSNNFIYRKWQPRELKPANPTRASSTTTHAAQPIAQAGGNAGAQTIPAEQPARAFHELIRNQQPSASIRQVSEETLLVPVESEAADQSVQLHGESDLVTLLATGADLTAVLRMIADHHKLNLVLGPLVQGSVTVSIRGAKLEEVLDAITGVAGFSWHRVDNLLYVTSATAPGLDRRVQGRRLQVYPLDYVSAKEVESVANGLLSEAGRVFVSESDSKDQLKTRELLVVEDVASAHERIAQYVAQIDVPPRQVLVEAHVLQIALGEDERHGINLRGLARLKTAKISIEGKNFAEEEPSTPAVALRVDSTDMGTLIDLIRSETNSRTLASPKLSVVNRQEAKIQIGQRLPYSVATTTQTTTVQSVEFLEVGIVLTVQPVITDDGNVLMTVLPKVSGGKITENGFPEEDTTEVQTTILLPDGGGVIIGGLIREEDVHLRSIVPGFGKIPVLGRLFRKRSDEVRRNELIVALVTHVMDEACHPRRHELYQLEEALPPHAAGELEHPQLPLTLQDYQQGDVIEYHPM